MRLGTSLIGLFLTAGVLAGGTCGPSSCVQFDSQSIVARHDEARDRLDLLLIYRDLTCARGGEPARAVDQLEKIRAGDGTFALLDNFPISFQEPHHDEQASAATIALRATLAHNVEVTNGLLWRDASGHLCGSQLVRIAHVTAVLEAANDAIADAFRSRLEGATRVTAAARAPDAPPASLDEWLTTERLQRSVTAGEAGYSFLALRGSTLAFSMPVAGDDVAQLRLAIVATIRREIDTREPGESWRQLDLLARNRLALDQVGEELRVVLGDPASGELRIESPPRGLAGADLGAALAARDWSVGGPDGEAQARAAFEAFCAER